MATRQVTFTPQELHIAALGHLNVALACLQSWNLADMENELARVAELCLAIKETAAVPKTNSVAEGKRA